MKFLFDTNAVIAVFRGDGALLSRLRQYSVSDFAVSAIVSHELYFGAYKSRSSAANLQRLERLQFELLDFTSEDARCAGEIRAKLALAGTPIGPLDVLIAGQAVARSLTLITNNTREFARVPGLATEDWLTPSGA